MYLFSSILVSLHHHRGIVRVQVVMRLSHARRSSAGLSLTKSQQSALRHGLRASLTFFPLLGIGWIVGPFAVHDGTVTLQYVFTIFASLQVRLRRQRVCKSAGEGDCTVCVCMYWRLTLVRRLSVGA